MPFDRPQTGAFTANIQMEGELEPRPPRLEIKQVTNGYIAYKSGGEADKEYNSVELIFKTPKEAFDSCEEFLTTGKLPKEYAN